MLWNASALTGYLIKTTDGQLGKVADLFYDPKAWVVRWLVVDTGDWLAGRRTILPVTALGQPDPESHHLPVNLTMKQIEEGPEIDDSEPLSQESEVLLRDHYGLAKPADDIYWHGHDRTRSDDPAAAEREVKHLDVGLHRLSEITGDQIEATDDEAGHADDFLIDTLSWQIRYLTVHSSNWWAGEKRLISPLSIEWIDWARSIIHLDVTCQKVKDSPPYIAAETVDGAFDELFQTYYGIRWVRR